MGKILMIMIKVMKIE